MSIISNIDNKHLTSVKLNDNIVSNKEVIGTFIKNIAEIEITNINHMYDDLKGQYLDIQGFGKWYVDDLKSDEEFVTSKLSLYDITNKFDEDYEDIFTFPNTLGAWATWIGDKVGVPLKGTFLNYDLILTKKPYLGSNPKYRDAVKQISKYAASYAQKNFDNTYSICWFDNTSIEIEDWENFVHSNKIPTTNVIVLSTGDTEDNVKYPNVTPPNPHELRIDDDWTNINRYSINEAIYNQINGFFYTPISKLNVPYGLLNLRAGQKIKTQDIEHIEVETYISKVTLEWQGGNFDDPNAWTTSIQMEDLKETSTKLKYANSFENRFLEVERKTDKNLGVIEDLISSRDGQNQKISQITQTVDSINSKISDIADITISGESTFATVTLEHINQSEPIQIKVHSTKEQDISYLYPSNYLYPSDRLFPQGRTIRFKNITTNEIFDYEIPQDLLYYDEDNYDEFILSYDSQTCYINKKVKHTDRNDVNILMSDPQTIECEFPKIELTDGDYTVELLGYKNGYIFCQLMAANMYTTQFATKPELRSEINQTKEEISLEVSKKANEDYVNSKITQSASEINLAISKKTDKSSIIATINLSSESATINASKVNINGIITAINNGTTTTIDGNRITTGSITSTQVSSDIITTKNFSAQSINANNIKSGTLSADRINGGSITGSTINLGKGKFVVDINGILSCTGASFNGSITGSTIVGGSINIDSGTGYYFNMGLSTSHPNCSGLNVGWGGINFNGGKGINNTDGYNFNFSSGCLYAVEKVQSVKGANITFGNNIGIYGGYIYCEVEKLEFSGGLWLNTNGTIGRSGNITINSSSSIDLLGGTYGVYASKGGGSTSAVKTDAGSYSSRIVKENIKKFTQKKYDDSLELLDRLELYSYDYKYNLYENKSKYGFIIDELEQNELSKEFFDFYEKEAIVNGKELDFNLTHRKETDKTIKLKNYDSDVLDKYLLTCVKALYNKIKNMEVPISGK